MADNKCCQYGNDIGEKEDFLGSNEAFRLNHKNNRTQYVSFN